jgi:hypothetical protein
MRRSRKPFRAVSSDEGSNPSPSALTTQTRSPCGFAPIGNADPQSTVVRGSPLIRVLTGERLANGTGPIGTPEESARAPSAPVFPTISIAFPCRRSEPPDERSRPCLLAAEITDGEDENPDEYRQQRSDQVIASATTASVQCGFAKPMWPSLLAASSINSSLMSRRRGRSPPPPCVIGRYLERA